MKKYLFLIAFSFLGVSAYALPCLENKDGEFFFSNDACITSKPKKPDNSKPRRDINLLLEAKAGYFFFTDSKMRKVYDGGYDVQLALSGRVWKWLFIYGSLEYIQCDGSSLNAHEPTKIQIVPLSIGLKPTFAIAKCLDYYLNIGPRYYFVHQDNDSNYVNRNVDLNGLGGFVGTGFLFHLNHRLVIDVYGEYSGYSTNFSSFITNVQGHKKYLGGCAVGGGLGYSF